MPPKMRRALLISMTMIALLFATVIPSYAETINYIYDELNRLKRVEYGDGTVIEYTYDKAGNRLEERLQIADTTPPTTTASPGGGIYNIAQIVTLTCNDGTGSGCDKIYYTTDGSIPTTSSPVYSSPINVSATTTLKFFARDLAGNSETVKTETYTISTNMVTVELKDSTGGPFSGGVVQYYSGGWQTFGTTDATGRTTKELKPGTYTFSMTYAFARQEKSQNIASNPTVVFQTTNVTIQLKDSTGALMDTGTVQYYSGGWREIGSTSGGQVSKELLPATYTFSMNYAFARQEKAQNISTNPTVVFQTIRATVELRDSTGTLMDTGTVQYYSGGWRDIGTTSGGQVSKELLPGSYTFRMNYAFARQEKAQNVATNPTVVFQTISATVQLKDSTGALMDTGTVKYYSGGWRDIGPTSGGQVNKELLPASYTFSMNYAFARQEKAQNLATNPTVVFQATNVTIQFKDSTGALMDTGTVQYYSGAWRDMGSTSGGQVSKEMLPGSYTFSMSYGFARQQKSQNIAADPTVVFQTGQVHSDSGSCTQYYASGWHVFTQDMELLPISYTFRFNDGTADTPYTVISGTGNHIH
jgi:YD repeat-containing protein